MKQLQDKFGKVDSMSKMRSGSLLVKTVSVALCTCGHLGDIPVSIALHQSLNMVQEVIFNRGLLQTDKEFGANLEW